MIYCTECGASNPDGTQVCIKCNTKLPDLGNVPAVPVETSPSTSSAVSASTPGPIHSAAPVASSSGSMSASWWQRLGPDLKAAAIVYTGFQILAVVNILTGGVGNIVTFPFRIVFSLGQGVLVARLASKDSRYTKADYFKLALLSGLWVSLIDMANIVLFLVVTIGITLGTVLGVLPGIILSSLGNYALGITLTILGAWFYGRYGGKKLVVALVGTGCGCMVICGILIAIVILVLATYGVKLFGS